MIEVRRPDIILIDKKERKGIIIDIAVPADVRVGKKKGRKWKSPRTQRERSEDCANSKW